MPRTFEEAESVESIAQGLIPNYHAQLATARILYVFSSDSWTKNGRELSGKVQKLSGFNEWAVERDFVIFVAQNKWNDMTESQRSALVDHLLSSCTGDEDDDTGEYKWKVLDPEVQEFTDVLFRHGAWHEGLVDFVKQAKKVNIEETSEETEDVDLTEDETVTTSES